MSHGDGEAPFVPEAEVVEWLLANHVSDVSEGTSSPVFQTSSEGRIYDLLKLEEGGGNGGTLVSLRALNLKNVMGLMTSSGVGVIATLADGKPVTRFMLGLGVIGLCNAAHTAFSMKIAENHTAVYWTLWVHRLPSTDLVVKEGLLDLVNTELRAYERSAIAQGVLDSSLVFWRGLRCISDAGKHWQLHEKVWLRLK